MDEEIAKLEETLDDPFYDQFMAQELIDFFRTVQEQYAKGEASKQ